MTAQVIQSTNGANGHIPTTSPTTSSPAIATATLVSTFAYTPPVTVSPEAQNTLASLPPLIARALNAPGVDLRAISASHIAETLVAAGVDQDFMLGQCPNEVFAVIRGMYSHVRTAYARAAASAPTPTEPIAPTPTSGTTMTQPAPSATSPVSTASASTAPSTPSTVAMHESPIVQAKPPDQDPGPEPAPIHDVVVVDARDFKSMPVPQQKGEVEDVQMADEDVPPVASASTSPKRTNSLPNVSGLTLDPMSPPPPTPSTATSLITPISATPSTGESGDGTPTPTRKRKRKSFAALALADVIPRGTDRMTPGKMRALGLASPSGASLSFSAASTAEVQAPSRPSSLARPVAPSVAGRRSSLVSDVPATIATATATAKKGRGGRGTLGRRASTSNVDFPTVQTGIPDPPLSASTSAPSSMPLDAPSPMDEVKVVADIVMRDGVAADEDELMPDVATSTTPSAGDAAVLPGQPPTPTVTTTNSKEGTATAPPKTTAFSELPSTGPESAHDELIKLVKLRAQRQRRLSFDDDMDADPWPVASTSSASVHAPSDDTALPNAPSQPGSQPESVDADPTPTPSPSKPAKRTRRPRPPPGTIAPVERTSSRSSASMAAARIAAIANMDEKDKHSKPSSPVKAEAAKDESTPKDADMADEVSSTKKKAKGRPKGKTNKKPKSSSRVASDAEGENLATRERKSAEKMDVEPAAASPTPVPSPAPTAASPTVPTATSPTTTTEPKRLTLKLTIPSLAARMQMRTDHGAASDSGSEEEEDEEDEDDSSGDDDSGASAAKRPRLGAKSEPPKPVPPPATDSDEEEFEASFMRPRTFGR